LENTESLNFSYLEFSPKIPFDLLLGNIFYLPSIQGKIKLENETCNLGYSKEILDQKQETLIEQLRPASSPRRGLARLAHADHGQGSSGM
jgi:hypothetical protein